MPQVLLVSGGLFLTRTVFDMLTWSTGHGIWYHLETTYPEQHHSLVIVGSLGAHTTLLQNAAKISPFSSLKVFKFSQQSRVLLRPIWYAGLVFLTLALDTTDQRGETLANDQHQSLTHTLPALCHCEARPTPQRPQRVKGNLLGIIDYRFHL